MQTLGDDVCTPCAPTTRVGKPQDGNIFPARQRPAEKRHWAFVGYNRTAPLAGFLAAQLGFGNIDCE